MMKNFLLFLLLKKKENTKSLQVKQYDLIGDVIGIFSSLTEASSKTGCHIYLISNCCNKKSYYTVNGTTFRYLKDSFDYYPYNKNLQKNSMSVCKFDSNGTFIEKYDSIRSAAKENNIGKQSIKRCCVRKFKLDKKGNLTTIPICVAGFTYRYFDDTFNI